MRGRLGTKKPSVSRDSSHPWVFPSSVDEAVYTATATYPAMAVTRSSSLSPRRGVFGFASSNALSLFYYNANPLKPLSWKISRKKKISCRCILEQDYRVVWSKPTWHLRIYVCMVYNERLPAQEWYFFWTVRHRLLQDRKHRHERALSLRARAVSFTAFFISSLSCNCDLYSSHKIFPIMTSSQTPILTTWTANNIHRRPVTSYLANADTVLPFNTSLLCIHNGILGAYRM